MDRPSSTTRRADHRSLPSETAADPLKPRMHPTADRSHPRRSGIITLVFRLVAILALLLAAIFGVAWPQLFVLGVFLVVLSSPDPDQMLTRLLEQSVRPLRRLLRE